MKKSLIFLFVVLGLTSAGLYETFQGKRYSKVRKKLEKLERKGDTSDIEYHLVVSLMEKRKDSPDLFKALHNIRSAQNKFKALPKKEQQKISEKLLVSLSSMKVVDNAVCKKVEKYTDSLTDIGALEKWRNQFSFDKSLYTHISSCIENVHYDNSCVKNSVEGYKNFLHMFPSSSHQWDIKRRLSNRAFLVAKEKQSIGALEDFLKVFPQAPEVPLARKEISAMAYNAIKGEEILEYQKFIENYPYSDEADSARIKIEDIEYKKLCNNLNLKEGKLFLKRYPATAKRLELEEKLRPLKLTYFESLTSPAPYLDFLKEYQPEEYVGISLDSIYARAVRLHDDNSLHRLFTMMPSEKENVATAIARISAQRGSYAWFQTISTVLDTFNNSDKMIYNSLHKTYGAHLRQKGYDFLKLGKYARKSSFYTKGKAYVRKYGNDYHTYLFATDLLYKQLDKKSYKSARQRLGALYPNGGKKNAFATELKKILRNVYKTTKVNKKAIVGVNTKKQREYVPIITADGRELYFCRRVYKEEIFRSTKEGKKWSLPQKVSSISTSSKNNAPLTISADGMEMIYFISGTLHWAKRIDEKWVKQGKLPSQLNQGTWNADAQFTSDGKGLLFTSDRKGSLGPDVLRGASGNTDIYYIPRVDSGKGWGTPINLGASINTEHKERTPFLHPDMKTLFFSTDGRGGLGTLDVFMSKRLSDTLWTEWSEPVNLGPAINTANQDWGYKISTDGTTAYYAQKGDLYTLTLPKSLRPNRVITVEGIVTDIKGNPMEVKVIWEDLETETIVGEALSDASDGSYFIAIPEGKNYGIHIEKEGYYPTAQNLDLSKGITESCLKLPIKVVSVEEMKKEGAIVTANNLFFDFRDSLVQVTSTAELKRIASIIQKNVIPLDIIGHTDSLGTMDFNQYLSEARARSVKRQLVYLGVDPVLLSTKGYGSSKPVQSNLSKWGRQQNRRVELKVVKKRIDVKR